MIHDVKITPLKQIVDERGKIMLERQPLTKLTKINQLRAFRHTGFWQCMDTTRDKNILLSLLKNKKAPWIRYK